MYVCVVQLGVGSSVPKTARFNQPHNTQQRCFGSEWFEVMAQLEVEVRMLQPAAVFHPPPMWTIGMQVDPQYGRDSDRFILLSHRLLRSKKPPAATAGLFTCNVEPLDPIGEDGSALPA